MSEFVWLTDPHLSKGVMLDYEGVMYRELYNLLWKKGEDGWKKITTTRHVEIPLCDVPPDSVDVDIEPPTLNLTPPKSLPFTYLDVSQIGVLSSRFYLLIRDEYTTLLQYIREEYSGSPEFAMVVLGQPGIGKTMFLNYLLLRRIVGGAPTVYSVDSKWWYIFLDTGAYRLQPTALRDLHCILCGIHGNNPMLVDHGWILCHPDSSQESAPIKPHFFRGWTCILASSSGKLYRKFWKDWKASMYVMMPWTWEEIVAGYPVQQYLFKNARPSLGMCREAFVKYGPSARVVYQHAMDKNYTACLVQAIKECTSIYHLHGIGIGAESIDGPLTRVEPAGGLVRKLMQVSVATRFITELLVTEASAELARSMCDGLDFYLKWKLDISMLFEVAGHAYLRRSGLHRYTIRHAGTRNVLSLNITREVVFSRIEDLSAETSRSSRYYYRPSQSHILPGIDAVVFQNPPILFRFVTDKRPPGTKSRGLELLKNILPETSNKWKLVFVMPKSYANCLGEDVPDADNQDEDEQVEPHILGISIMSHIVRAK